MAANISNESSIVVESIENVAEVTRMTLWKQMNEISITGGFMQRQWDKVVDLFGGDEKFMISWGTGIVLFSTYWFINCFFMYLDLTGKPSFLLKYKIEPRVNVQVDRKKFMKCLKVVVRNELIADIMPVLIYNFMVQRGISALNPLPSIFEIIRDAAVFIVAGEAVFYYSHRIEHHPALYKHIHKMHHEWVIPISIASSYSHIIEYLVSLVSLFIGPLIMGSHLFVIWTFFGLHQIQTCINHSNYHFPGLHSPQNHDYHHAKFTDCYGGSGLFDWMHGTDKNFKKSLHYKRHKTYFSLTPITELIKND